MLEQRLVYAPGQEVQEGACASRLPPDFNFGLLIWQAICVFAGPTSSLDGAWWLALAGAWPFRCTVSFHVLSTNHVGTPNQMMLVKFTEKSLDIRPLSADIRPRLKAVLSPP